MSRWWRDKRLTQKMYPTPRTDDTVGTTFRALGVVMAAVTLLTIGCQASSSAARSTAPAPSASVAPEKHGIVQGQVGPCVGDYQPTPPPPPAATVLVLREFPTVGPYVLPTGIVASESIQSGGEFRFTLPPGPYVLVARWRSVTSLPSAVQLAAGQTTSIEIQFDCY
jgi:hypothetical protein